MSKGFGFNLDHLNVTAEDWSVIKAYEGREPHPPQASKVIDLSEGVIGRKASIENRSASGRRVNMRDVRRTLDLMLSDIDSAGKSRPDDIGPKPSDTEPMNDITREELSSTLSAIEERMDRRVERMEQDSARRSDDLRREMRLRERSARRESIATKEALQAHIESNDKAVASTLAALERTEKEFGTVKQANKEQRYWMAGIGVAIVLGIMGANATIFGGGKTFFDGGANSVVNQQHVEKLIQEAKAQSDANSALLKQIQTRQESLVAPSPAKP